MCSNRDSAHLKRADNLNRHIFMESQKIYLAGNGGTDVSALLASALQNRGVDPNILAVMGNRNGGAGGWGGNDFFAILLLFILMGAWGNNGLGGGFGGGNNGGLPLNMLSNDSSRELIMSAIQRNGVDISQLASTLNCSIGQVTAGINALATQISTLAGQQGMSAQQIINSIQAGNCQLTAQLAQCCCDIKSAIGTVNTGLERGFSAVAYETQRQTCDLQNTIRETSQNGMAAIIGKLDQMQTAALQEKIDAMREKNSTLTTQLNLEHQNAYMAGVVGQAIAPVNAAVAALQNDVNGIKCKLPETATIPYSPVVGVPTCVAAQYGLAAAGLGLGFGNGFWG